jgi:hypothetical protein
MRRVTYFVRQEHCKQDLCFVIWIPGPPNSSVKKQVGLEKPCPTLIKRLGMVHDLGKLFIYLITKIK